MNRLKHSLTKAGLTFALTMMALGSFAYPNIASAEADKHQIKGDFRLRHSYLDQEGQSIRNRDRFRARVQGVFALRSDIRVTTGLASGDDSPTSTNVSFDNAFSSKPLRLDLAFIEWTPEGPWTLRAGKMFNPFFQVGSDQLVWDSDVRPEGFNVSASWGESSLLHLHLGGFWLKERGAPTPENDASDSMLYAAQAYYDGKLLTESLGFVFGASYYEATYMDGYPTLYSNSDGLGNTVDTVTVGTKSTTYYTTEFKTLEGFTQFRFNLGLPLVVFYRHLQNLDTDENSSGWSAGLKVGSMKNQGGWELGYAYRYLESDVWIGVFPDSDLGNGGTDLQGHVASLGYGIRDNVTAKLTTYFVDENISRDETTDVFYGLLDIEFLF